MKTESGSRQKSPDKSPSVHEQDDFRKHSDFEFILEVVRYIAALARRDDNCIREHRQNLKNRGEEEGHLCEFDHWRESQVFTEREKAAMVLSESISLKMPDAEVEQSVSEVRRHFQIGEVVSLTLAIMAINEWLDLRSEKCIRVLVVEDSPYDQELLRRQLAKTQMEENVIFVPDASQALVVLEGYQNGLFNWELIAVFLDIHLPGMNGIEFLQRLRAMPDMEHLPVIVMTSSNNPRDIEECHRLKVASYVEKPVTFNTFSKAVANIFHSGKASPGLSHHLVE